MSGTHTAPRTAALSIAAASQFLSKLSPEQRPLANLDFDTDERHNWHYVPKARQGLALGEMSDAQSEAALAMIAGSLSDDGYRKALSIIDHEVILGGIEAGVGVGRWDRDSGLYYFTVFGNPGTEEAWGWRVEGHHLSLNYAIVDGESVSPTPSFFGANPASVPSGPSKGLRILEEEEDRGRDLVLSLDSGQMEQAILYPVAPPDIISRASPRVDIGDAAGLSASAMSGDQRSKLMALIQTYLERKSADVAAKALERLSTEGLDAVRFGWAGSRDRGQAHYYRIQGSSLFIEYDNTQDMANHIHSVWRDVDGDFGRDLLSEHYRAHHA
jgi:hypothetical protein